MLVELMQYVLEQAYGIGRRLSEATYDIARLMTRVKMTNISKIITKYKLDAE
jgi:hypothetical protein